MQKTKKAKISDKPIVRRGKPRLYGSGAGQLCVPLSVSVPFEVADRLRTAADQIGVSPSVIAAAGLRSILTQSQDRLAAQIASGARASE